MILHREKKWKKRKKTALFSSNIKKKNKIIGYPPFFLVLYFTVSKREVKQERNGQDIDVPWLHYLLNLAQFLFGASFRASFITTMGRTSAIQFLCSYTFGGMMHQVSQSIKCVYPAPAEIKLPLSSVTNSFSLVLTQAKLPGEYASCICNNRQNKK